MVILRDKGMNRLSMKLLIRASDYNTMTIFTVLTIHQIKTNGRENKIWDMVCTRNSPVKDDGCILNLDSSSGIYMN